MRTAIKILVAIICVSTAFYSCKDKKKEQPKEDGYVVTGTVKGLDNSYAKITDYQLFNKDKINVIDSVPIVNGKFKFTGEIAFPDMVTLELGEYKTQFFLENSNIKISVDVSNVKNVSEKITPEVIGSKGHSQYAAVEKKSLEVFNDKKYDVFKEVRQMFAKAKKEGSDELLQEALKKQKSLQSLSQDRNERYKKSKFDFVKANPSSAVAPYVLGVQYTEGRMSREQLKEYYELFTGDARKATFFKTFITKIYKDNFENVGVGNTAPDFTLQTVQGDELTLSKVEGKYILVDFWASWCVPCRNSFPHLKELRKQYKNKGFTIVGVGTADEKEKWKKAIKEDNTLWNHVYDSSENHAYGPVAESYGVPHLPTTLLVDSNRKIILRNPSKQELDNKLKELFAD
ncbi:thiol-disulfide isomerase/thioredoxin [Cellulophaga sp. RHA_52]|uniref:TlpA disulfide reductase family protein n=1 Tax=Cellulophaga sp. RHA_52 TaxID=1250036 RepID=UPI00119ADBBD|nr:TlpA disulfide reductase family protein [Cellulophaga sp. RHA_52]TVZ10421.1 thiol-disulfide isomerase/thioredoxin [Cellulophaga sp. RHA_52]